MLVLNSFCISQNFTVVGSDSRQAGATAVALLTGTEVVQAPGSRTFNSTNAAALV